MKFLKLIQHFFTPHTSNNQKAKMLHPTSLFVVAIALMGFQILLGLVDKTFPRVLGYAANISPEEVIRLTNVERVSNGLGELKPNTTLSQAALAKGNDMLAKGYWAHFAPDGTTPWSFILSFGYKYKYAGENLARDFSDAGSAVRAWMNSPTHRENILNSSYQDIGIGVVEGNLLGVDTTIIVQFFGTPLDGGSANIKEVKAQTVLASPEPDVLPTPTPTPTPLPTPSMSPDVVTNASGSSITFVSPFSSTKGISLFVTGMLLMILSIDLIIVKRNKIVRVGGKSLAHIAFLGMILAVILILKAGQII